MSNGYSQSGRETRPVRRGPLDLSRLFGLPIGVFVAVLVILPVALAYGLIEHGMSSHRGSAIAIGLIIGAVWLGFMVFTARAVTDTDDAR